MERYGYYKSFRGLKAAIEEGRADFYINRYSVFAACFKSKKKALMWFEFSLRALLPAIAIVLFNTFYVHSKWFWIPLIIHVVLAILQDTGELFVFIAVIFSVFGIFRHHPFVILCTAPFVVTYLATALSWKLMNETLKKECLVSAETFDPYWNEQLVMVKVGDTLYSSQNEAKFKPVDQKKAKKDTKGRPISRREEPDSKTQRQREEEYAERVAAYKVEVERKKAAKEAEKAARKAAKHNK